MPHSLKKKIQHALEINDLQSVAMLARGDRKVLSRLVRLAYDKDTLTGWRAIRAIGFAAREMAETDPAFLRETCRKLLWSLTDESGGIGWSAPEILGEIVSSDPGYFSDIIPLIVEVYDIEEKVFRPGVVYALARIAETDPDRVLPYEDLIALALGDSDPLVRYFAIELVLRVKHKLDKSSRERMTKAIEGCLMDCSEIWVYEDDGFKSLVIRDLAMKAQYEVKNIL